MTCTDDLWEQNPGTPTNRQDIGGMYARLAVHGTALFMPLWLCPVLHIDSAVLVTAVRGL